MKSYQKIMKEISIPYKVLVRENNFHFNLALHFDWVHFLRICFVNEVWTVIVIIREINSDYIMEAQFIQMTAIIGKHDVY